MFSRTTAERLSETTLCVVIGASRYDAPGLRPLPMAAPEGAQVGLALQAADGLAIPSTNIACLVADDAKVDAVRVALKAVRTAATAESTLVIYFAGHGVAMGEREFGLCVTDTVSAADPASMITSTYLEELFRDCPARGILFIVDCCGGAGLAERAPAMFSAVRQAEFRILLSASRQLQSSWETPEGSFFTTFLLRALRGQVALGEEPGSLFFNDLYTYLHDSVLEHRETKYPQLPPQEPVFAGSYLRDPLLFVHGKLSRARLVIRTRRYSKEYLRRTLLRSAAAAAVVVAVSVGSYWAYLDQREFARLTEAGLEVWKGHPTFQGFGLPRLIWTFDVGRDEVSPDSPLARGDAISAAAPPGVLSLVPSQLNDLGQVRWTWSNGDRQVARERLRAIVDRLQQRTAVERIRAVQMLAWLGETKDMTRLIQAMAVVPVDYQRDVVRGVVRLGQADGLARLLNGDAGDAGKALVGQAITELKVACEPTLQTDLGRFARYQAVQNDVPPLYYVATKTGCRLPLSLLGRAWTAHVDVVAAHLGTMYVEQRAGIVESLTKTLEATAAGKYEQSAVDARLKLLTLLPKGRCPAIGDLKWLDPKWRLHLNVALVLAKACEGRSLRMATAQGRYELQLLGPANQSPQSVLQLTAGKQDEAFLIELLQVFRRQPIEGDVDVLLDIVQRSDDEVTCRMAMQILHARGMAPPPTIARFFDTTYKPLITVALVYWAKSHRSDTMKRVQARMSDPVADFIPGVLAHLEPSQDERRELLDAASSDRVPTERRAGLVAMLGDAQSAIRVLCSSSPAVRKAALAAVGLRSDLEDLLDRPTPADCSHAGLTQGLLSIRDTKSELKELLAAGPPEFRDLRANITLFYHPTHNEGLRTWVRKQCFDCE